MALLQSGSPPPTRNQAAATRDHDLGV